MGQCVAHAEEQAVGEVHESVERVRAEVARVDAEAEDLRSRRAMLDELDDAVVEAVSESWQRVGAVEERSVGELQGAAERVRVLLEQADADGEAVRARMGMVEQLVDGLVERRATPASVWGRSRNRRSVSCASRPSGSVCSRRRLTRTARRCGRVVGMVEQLVDGFVERTRDAGQRVGEVEESSVGELRESVERVRSRVDAEAEDLRSRRAMLDELDDALVEAASESWLRVAAVEERSVGELQGAAERVRVLLEQADADGEAVRSRRGTVEELVDAFVERTNDAGQRVGISSNRRSVSCTSRWGACGRRWRRSTPRPRTLRSRRAMLDELDDALVEAASESWLRVAAVEERSVGELQGAAERVRVLLEQADADGEAVRSRRGTVEELVDAFVERTNDAGQRVGEVEESSVGELRESVERVRLLMAEADADGEAVRAAWEWWSSWSTVSSSGRATPVSVWGRSRNRRSVSCASRWSGCGPTWRRSRPRPRRCGRAGSRSRSSMSSWSTRWSRPRAGRGSGWRRSRSGRSGSCRARASGSLRASREPKPTATTCSRAVRSSGNWSTRSPHVLVNSANAWPKSSSSSIEELRRATARISEYATHADADHDDLSTPEDPGPRPMMTGTHASMQPATGGTGRTERSRRRSWCPRNTRVSSGCRRPRGARGGRRHRGGRRAGRTRLGGLADAHRLGPGGAHDDRAVRRARASPAGAHLDPDRRRP